MYGVAFVGRMGVVAHTALAAERRCWTFLSAALRKDTSPCATEPLYVASRHGRDGAAAHSARARAPLLMAASVEANARVPSVFRRADEKGRAFPGNTEADVETVVSRPLLARNREKGVTSPGTEGETHQIQPKSKGETNDSSNAQHLSRDCNIKKSDKMPTQ